MAQRFPLQLAVVAGHPAMTGTGPFGDCVVEIGLVIASTDALAYVCYNRQRQKWPAGEPFVSSGQRDLC